MFGQFLVYKNFELPNKHANAEGGHDYAARRKYKRHQREGRVERHVFDGQFLAAGLVKIGPVAVVALDTLFPIARHVLGVVAFDTHPAAVVALLHLATFALLFAHRPSQSKFRIII